MEDLEWLLYILYILYYTVHQATATPEEEQGSAQIKGSNRATFSSAEISLTLFYMYKNQ